MTGDGGSSTPETLDSLRDTITRQAEQLARQQATIEQQTAELSRLNRRIDEDLVVRDLREAVRLSAAATVISAPTSHGRLLDMIVATAADIIGANGTCQ